MSYLIIMGYLWLRPMGFQCSRHPVSHTHDTVRVTILSYESVVDIQPPTSTDVVTKK